MKLLDVVGTNSESFSIGLGEKKVEFRSIEGIFYFRNFGSGWQRASSELVRESIKLRTWISGIILSQDEIFLYNNSLWYSVITFETTNFSADSSNFIKIADLLNFNKISITGNANPIYYLSVQDSDTTIINGESSLDIQIILPDATTLNLGRKFTFINESNTKTYIFKRNTNESFLINPDESITLIINENSTEHGIWSRINSGGGGGSSGSSNTLSVILNLSQYGGINPFINGEVVYYNIANSKWEKAYSGNFDLNILGVIIESDLNLIKIAFFGELQFVDPLSYNNVTISPNTLYYLTDNPSNAGQVTTTPPPINNPKKIFISITTSKILLLDLGQSIQKNDNEIILTLNLANYGGSNPFVVGNIISYNTSTNLWELAYYDNYKLDILYFVTYSSGNIIKIASNGEIMLSSPLSYNSLMVTPGTVYYLTESGTDPGKAISSPAVIGNDRKLFLPLTTTRILLLNLLRSNSSFNEQTDNSLNFTLNLANYGGTNPFAVNDFIYFNQSNNKWEKAYSSTFDIDIIGFVTYSDTNSIKISFEGPVELKNTITVTPGVYYYLTSESGSAGSFVSTNLKNERKLFLAITNKIIVLTPQNNNRFNDIVYYSLNNGGTQILNNSETGLTYKISGYVYNDNNFITFSGLINNGTTLNAMIESNSEDVFSFDVSPGLCFIESGNDLIMKNNLGSTKIIVINREKFKT